MTESDKLLKTLRTAHRMRRCMSLAQIPELDAAFEYVRNRKPAMVCRCFTDYGISHKIRQRRAVDESGAEKSSVFENEKPSSD